MYLLLWLLIAYLTCERSVEIGGLGFGGLVVCFVCGLWFVVELWVLWLWMLV